MILIFFGGMVEIVFNFLIKLGVSRKTAENDSEGIEHQDSFSLTAGDVILVQSGDFVKVVNESEHDQLTYLRVFDREGWRI